MNTEIKVGDIVLVVSYMRAGFDRRLCGITRIVDGYAHFEPVYDQALLAKHEALSSGWGGMYLDKIGTTRFGNQSAEVVASVRPPVPHWYPQPGDRGYDLMC